MNKNPGWRLRSLGLATFAALATALPALAADETPHRGGTLVFGVNGSDPPTYDCHATNVFTIPMLITPHYSTLLKVDAAHYPQVVGDVAESWEVAPDHQTYTFHLHNNVKFHDGSPLTAADVKATFERIRNPPPGVASVRQNLLVDVAAIETPDPSTVIFRLKQPNRAMLYTFTLPWNCLYSAAKLKEDANYPATHIMGSGPYRLVEHVRGSHWVGARFDGYFKPGLPYLDGFKGVFIQGPALVNAIQGGQVMVDFRSQSVADKDRLVQALGDKVTVEESPWLNALMIVFNTEHKPFDDPRVRRALSLALDRWAASAALQKTTILRSVGGIMRPGYSLAASEAELSKLPGFSHDIAASRAEARRLLKEAGQEHLTFKLLNRSNPPNPFVAAGVFLLDQWHQIGVEVENGPVLESQWSAAMNAGNFDVALDVQADTIDEPDFQLARYLSNDIAPNRPRFIDRTLDDLYKQQSEAPDATARYQAIRRYEARFMDEAYMVPILWWHRIVVLPKTIHGWYMSPTHLAFQDLEQVWLSPAP